MTSTTKVVVTRKSGITVGMLSDPSVCPTMSRMPKISKFVLVSPQSFYVRKPTYMCTGCGRSFKLETESLGEELKALEREHFCQIEEVGTVSGCFPLIRLLRAHQPKKTTA